MSNINKNFDKYIDHLLGIDKLLDEPPKSNLNQLSNFKPISNSILRNSNLLPLNLQPFKKRNIKVPIPESKKTVSYYKRRIQNNAAARISREKTRIKKEKNKKKLIDVKQTNKQLKDTEKILHNKLEMLKSKISLLNNGKDTDTIAKEYTAKQVTLYTAIKTSGKNKTILPKTVLEKKFHRILNMGREEYSKELKYNTNIQKLSLDDKKELKKIRRKYQGRIISKNARLRSKNMIINLERKIHQLTNDNKNLENKIKNLKN